MEGGMKEIADEEKKLHATFQFWCYCLHLKDPYNFYIVFYSFSLSTLACLVSRPQYFFANEFSAICIYTSGNWISSFERQGENAIKWKWQTTREAERTTERTRERSNERGGGRGQERKGEIERERERETSKCVIENCMKYVRTDFCEFFGLLSSGGLCKTFK